MSAYNVEKQWLVLDGYGKTLGCWNRRPSAQQIRICIEPALDETMGPFILVEAFRREVWDADYSDNTAYPIDMSVPPAPAAAPVQSGPRKVIIR